jgi:DNA-binding transcriptional regulator PaaX
MYRNKLAKRVLEEFIQIGKDLAWFTDNASIGPYGQIRWAKIPKTSYYRKLRKFEKTGLIRKIQKKNTNTIRFELTAKAKWLRKQPSQKAVRSDGLSTIVTFDIAEEKHKARDNFRRYLLKNGYTQVQKSIFISPFGVFKEMKELAKELEIVSNISIIAGKLQQF